MLSRCEDTIAVLVNDPKTFLVGEGGVHILYNGTTVERDVSGDLQCLANFTIRVRLRSIWRR